MLHSKREFVIMHAARDSTRGFRERPKVQKVRIDVYRVRPKGQRGKLEVQRA